MKRFNLVFIMLLTLLFLSACTKNTASKSKEVNIVTSTNIYANIAKQVVGNHGKVKPIISNGNTDPHDFEATFNSAKEVADANIVIANGLGYDDWMKKLADSNDVKVVEVGEDLLHKKTSDNPHIWYDLEMPKVYALYIEKKASEIDPTHKKEFHSNTKKYLQKIEHLKQLASKIDGKQSKPVYVSEPVFDYALEEAGFRIGDKEFEKAVENETDPSAQTVHKMQLEIKQKKIAFFVNNTQASSSTVTNFVKLCHENKIPVLNVRETMPNGVSYLAWMTKNYEKLAEISK